MATEHHVYFWLKEDFKDPESRGVFEKGLAALFEIDSVCGGSWGIPAATPERPVTEKSWDYGLSIKFDSIALHDAYQEDAAHDVFVDQFKDWWEKVQVLDLEQQS